MIFLKLFFSSFPILYSGAYHIHLIYHNPVHVFANLISVDLDTSSIYSSFPFVLLLFCILYLYMLQTQHIIVFITSYNLYFIHLVQFSCSVVSACLRPHGLQDVRPPCPSPTPRVYSNSWPLS